MMSLCVCVYVVCVIRGSIGDSCTGTLMSPSLDMGY